MIYRLDLFWTNSPALVVHPKTDRTICTPLESHARTDGAHGVTRPTTARAYLPPFTAVIAAWMLVLSSVVPVPAQPFQLPTANRALFEKEGEERFFVGTVAYLNTRPSLSNFGNYIVLRHAIGGVDIYSSYAHLREIRPGLKAGQTVKAGEAIATMGRTANTHEGISKDRAHLHFELNLFVNDRFPAWHKKTFPGQRNDHGVWNGQNLIGLDPRLILVEQQMAGAKFDLWRFIQGQTGLCRVVVRATDFPWLRRYPGLVRPNPKVAKEGIAGYEVALNFNAVAFELIPRAASEIKGQAKFQLLSVNETECHKNRCRRLVTQRGGRWELTSRGLNALELLTY